MLILFIACAGIYYRPESLKSMTVLVGNTEKRIVYKNFELLNLHQNKQDFTHTNYEHYLENNYFLPPPGPDGGGDGASRLYWAHTTNNLLPREVSTTLDKGLFNVFPLDLMSLESRNSTASSLGSVFYKQF